MRYKYPRTPHVPWSNSVSADDEVLSTAHVFKHMLGKEVVITEKMDGENTTLYRDHIHARSLDSKDHPSRHWVKQLWATIRHDIPAGCRICGENMYAKHSIYYTGLPSYFMVFSAWQGKECLSWQDTEDICSILGLTTVPVLYKGPYDERVWKSTGSDFIDRFNTGRAEGYVVRRTGEFPYEEFEQNVAKFVRPNHVQTDERWMHGEVVKNLLA